MGTCFAFRTQLKLWSFPLQSSILNQYNTYVLHLEKALQQVESAILAAEAASKRSDKGLVPDEVRLGRYLLVNPLEHSLPISTASETDFRFVLRRVSKSLQQTWAKQG